ncbi:MAG TPA: BPSS1780 family membrane protein [Burkholderiales bacterium]|nr:BPSS1780 family membrane protein [Burkholderiales bacterium]
MSTNPYATPKTDAADAGSALQGNFVPEGHTVPAGHGWTWIAAAWDLFKRAPVVWIGMVLTFAVIFCVLAFIPILGSLVSFALGPVFGAGFVIGCRALDEGGELKFGHLFAGFQTRFGTLVAVGLLYLAASFVVMLVVGLIAGVSMFAIFWGGADPANIGVAFATMGLAFLVVTALMLPVVMAIWFAPPLVVFNELGAFDALKASFLGCLKNMVSFLVYGLILFGFAILASIPFGLGWLVLAPVIGTSIYTAYRDIYFR